MKKFLILIGVMLGLSGLAQTVPTFVTSTAQGSSSATVYFASQPLQQVRIVGAIASSDLSSSTIAFATGITPHSVTYSNASGTSIYIDATNGWAASDVLVIEGKNGTTNVTISSFTGSTNITTSASTGFATLPGDQLYKLGTAVTLTVGAKTNVNYQGEAIFVGNRGRPVRAVVTGTSYSSADSITGRYE